MKTITWSICGLQIPIEISNNAWPITQGECCPNCNRDLVIPARLLEQRTQEIYQAYMEQYGSILPTSKETVKSFLTQNKDIIKQKPIQYIIDLIQDYIGSQQLYDPEYEQTW